LVILVELSVASMVFHPVGQKNEVCACWPSVLEGCAKVVHPLSHCSSHRLAYGLCPQEILEISKVKQQKCSEPSEIFILKYLLSKDEINDLAKKVKKHLKKVRFIARLHERALANLCENKSGRMKAMEEWITDVAEGNAPWLNRFEYEEYDLLHLVDPPMEEDERRRWENLRKSLDKMDGCG
jgi:hypothetical protein